MRCEVWERLAVREVGVGVVVSGGRYNKEVPAMHGSCK